MSAAQSVPTPANTSGPYTAAPMSVARLGDPATLDARAFGSKSATLARLAARFRVPPGFCLSATVYDELHGALTRDGRAERVRLRQIVARAYDELGAPRVAVRSSAIGEDGAETSFAGQHDTILGVQGVDAVVDGILDCWRSAASERANAYRRERGIAAPARVAVLVQTMVESEVSAIAFSVDPVNGDEGVIVIDAARGLGERIASGEITPDRYVVRKADLTAVSGPPAGSLSRAEATAIAALVRELAELQSHPVDVECAFSRGQLQLLQCRPITTLARRDEFPVIWADARDAELNWTREDAHFPLVIPPLCLEYVRCGPAFGLRRRAELLGMPFYLRYEPFNGHIYAALAWDVPPAEREARNRESMVTRRAFARELPRLWRDDYVPRLLAHYAWIRAIDADAVSLPDLAGRWEELWTRINDVWTMHMLTTGGAYVVMDELAETYMRLTGGGQADALALTAGRAPTLQRLDRDVYALAELARRSSTIAEAFASDRARDLATLRALPGGDELVAAIERFLDEHGDVGQSGEDLRRPAWRDDPSFLIADLARRLAAPGEHPDVRLRRLIDAGDGIAARARETLRDRPGELAGFEAVLALAREAGPLTEEHNYWIDRLVQAHVRRAALAIGRRLVDEGLLGSADDVFFFYVPEISAALRARLDLRGRVVERAADVARWSRMPAPDWIGAAPAPAPAGGPPAARVDLGYKVVQQDSGRLVGVPASGGIARGPARLIATMDDFPRMRPGDVLVCRSSNVSWIPLFTVAAAVVTEVGGALSHAAVVAREFGVPAVVATGVALSTLADDQLVEVDGSAGTVRVLDPAPGRASPNSAAHAAATTSTTKSGVEGPPEPRATPTLTDASIPPK